MKTKLNARTTKFIYWVSALLIALLTASTYTFTGFASPIAQTGLTGFGEANNTVISKSLAVVRPSNSVKIQSKTLFTADAYSEIRSESVVIEPVVAAPVVETAPVVAAPVVETAPVVAETTVSSFVSLSDFAGQVTNGNGGQITGLYSANIFALSVVQQSGNAGYVSTAGNTTTQFSMASGLGFLAHNYLAGSDFFSLYGGATVTVVYGDGHTSNYSVSEIRNFQALSPDSPYSDFVDLASGGTLSATDLFYQTFGVSGQMVLQTCISKNGNSSWGRIFIIATPEG